MVLFSVLLDTLGAGVIAFVFGGADKALVFAVTFTFMLTAPCILGVWSLLKFWIGYALFYKGRLTRVYLAALNRHTLPSAAHHYDGTSYLREVMEDATEIPAVRASAAFLLGEMQATKTLKPFSLGMASRMTLEAAMSQYQSPTNRFSTEARAPQTQLGI